MRLFWHRRDPRLRDNAGLAAAARADSESVLPVYVYDSDLFGAIGERQQAFWMHAVRELKEAYRERESDLIVRAGDPGDIIPALAEEYDIDGVHCNQHYRPGRQSRRERVASELDKSGIAFDVRTDHVLVDPGRLDASYPNHSQFHNDWEDVPKRSAYDSPPAEALVDITDSKTVPVPTVEIDLPPSGYEAARDRLDRFCDRGIYDYNDTRDDLAQAAEKPTTAVSRMSPYLSGGMIGIREVWDAASSVYEAVHGNERRNADKYRYELSWREQNYHLLYYNPDLAVSNYKSIPNEIQWRDDDEAFKSWALGQTGYPLVDAGMRQLNREGYIHNRPRQVVASFLTKHLLVDWRRGARYFTKQLIDHDYASNHGSWQWIASTGTDSVDVRIFDPVSQLSKYDDGANFVREYVPELSDTPTEKIIEWPTLSPGDRAQFAPEYPDPIVGRNEGYERAQQTFEKALGKR